MVFSNRTERWMGSSTLVLHVALLLLLAAAGCARPAPAEQQLKSGYQAIGQGNPDLALQQADVILAQPAGPGTAGALTLRGRALESKADAAGKAQRTDEARQLLIAAGDAYTRAIAAKPPREIEGLARAGLANVAFFLDDYDTSLREWPAAILLTDDVDAQAWTAYRIGVCQQRKGWFELADQTFDRVRRQFASAAGGVPAARAGQAMGARAFFVQVATFSSQAAADKELATLKKQGVTGFRQSDVPKARYYVRIGPIPTYSDAKTLQARMTGRYADALILP